MYDCLGWMSTQKSGTRHPQQIKLDFEFTEKNKGAKGIQQEIEVELKWYEGDKGPVQLK